MKKLFIILGVIFAVITVVIITVGVIFIPRVLKLDHEATAYIQEAVPKIADHWNKQELMDRATPEFLARSNSDDQINRPLVTLRQLGSLKHLEAPHGVVTTSTSTGVDTVTWGNYTAQAEFEKGNATFEIQLRRVNDTWKINGFRIYSEVFLPAKN